MIIEAAVIEYLSTQLDVPVYAERPEKEEAAYVLVEKTGSTTANLVTTSTIAVQSYGATLYDAAGLNEDVKDAMRVLPQEQDICACYLDSDYNFTSTASKHPRYQAVFSVTHY